MKGIQKMQMMLAAFVLAAVPVFADRIISVNDLPKNIRDTLAEAFPENQIHRAKADSKEYEITLADGTEIDFYRDGEWKEIDSYSGIPALLLPEYVTEYVAANFPGETVCTAEKNRRELEVELSDGTELYFSYDGSFLGQKTGAHHRGHHHR